MAAEQVAVGGIALRVTVVVRRDADENAGAAAGKAVDALPGVFQRLPCHLEQQPVLWVDVRGFPRGNAEERRIPLVDAVHEAAAAQVRTPRLGGVRVVGPQQARAVGRYVGDRIHAVAQQRPEFLGRVRAAWKSAADADDGDVFPLLGLHVVTALWVDERRMAACAPETRLSDSFHAAILPTAWR